MFVSFLKLIGLTTGVIWGVLVLPLYLFAGPETVWGALGGCLLAAVCFIGGFYAVCRFFRGSFKALMITVFGGMFARLIVIGSGFALIVSLTSLDLVSFLSSLLGFYMLYLIIELHFINNRLQSREGGQK